MLRSVCVLVVVVPLAVFSLNCYNYMRASTTNPAAIQRTSLTCPIGTNFCMKSFVEQVAQNGLMSWVEQRGCATPQTCQQNGCLGNQFDQVCCCNGNLCNGATEKVGMLAVVAPIAVYLLNKMAV